MDDITNLSPRNDHKFQYMNFSFEVSDLLLQYSKEQADKIIGEMAIRGLHDMIAIAAQEGYVRLSTADLRQGKRYFAQAVFIHPDDYRNLMRDLMYLDGGQEIIKKYFENDRYSQRH